MYFFIFFVPLYFIRGIYSEETTTLRTPLGLVQGSYAKSYTARNYKAYQSIPYAQPPVGIKRFQPPEAIKKWNNVLYAINGSNVCIHYLLAFGNRDSKIRGDEDCLYLNIYVPIHRKNQLLPVIFYIHGGAFTFSSTITKATFIMDKDVIFVSFNYRLGIFGFLSTEDHHIPGNMGLKDQSMALRWISENIEYFGGDPKRITLLGNSAGAISIHLHYLSPLSRGLFQNGISLGGPLYIDKGSRRKFQKLLTKLKCPTKNISETIECLRQTPAEKITEAMQYFAAWLVFPMIRFGPVVEIGSQKPFLDRSPIDIISSGDVYDALWITSVVSEEGLIPAYAFVNENANLEDLDKRWNSLAPPLLYYNFSLPVQKHNYYSTLIRNHYVGDHNFTEKHTKALISLFGDGFICGRTIRIAKLLAQRNKSPVLFMYYSYRAVDSITDYFMKKPADFGVCHSDDLVLMMGSFVIDPTKRAEDRAAQMKLLDFIVSVAAEGYPNFGQNVSWQRVKPNSESLDLLHFASAEDIKMESRENLCEHKFWDKIYDAEK